MKEQILYDILYVAILVVLGIISRYLIPFIKEKLGTERFAQLENEIRILVRYAQQVYEGKTGEEKLYIVENEIKKWLDEKGFTVPNEQVRQVIESCVKSMKLEGGAAA